MIELTNLQYSFGKKELFKQEGSITLENGVNYLVGLNGSGKTTLFKLLLGLLPLQKGTILYDQMKPDEAITEIGASFDTPRFYSYLSGLENLQYFNSMMPNRLSKDALASLMKQWELPPDQTPFRNYSFGMRKKLSIILSLLSNPKYWFLDEPFNGLDVDSKQKIYHEIKNFAHGGNTVLLSAHEIGQTLSLADHILLIYGKKIQYYPNIERYRDLLTTFQVCIPMEVTLPNVISKIPTLKREKSNEQTLCVASKYKMQLLWTLQQEKIPFSDECDADDSLKDIVERLEDLTCSKEK